MTTRAKLQNHRVDIPIGAQSTVVLVLAGDHRGTVRGKRHEMPFRVSD